MTDSEFADCYYDNVDIPECIALLGRARRLIRKPEHWCQGAMARDKDGVPEENRENVASFCATGALWYVYSDSDFMRDADEEKADEEELDYQVMMSELDNVARSRGSFNIQYLNDGVLFDFDNPFTPEQCHAEVLKCYDEAMDNLKEKLNG